MKKKRAVFALIFRILGLILGISAVTVHMLINSGLRSGFMVKHNLAYFTLQTNIFCSCIFALLVFKGIRALSRGDYEIPQLNHSLHTACSCYISITMLGFWLALAPVNGAGKGLLLLDSLLLHTFMPLWSIADWLLFSRHGGLGKKELSRWFIYPLLYLASLIILSFLINEPYYSLVIGGKSIELFYPYPFIDPSVIGIWGFVAAVLLLSAFFFLLGLLYIKLDSRLSGQKSRA